MESNGLKSLSTMFSERLYRIPDYQRGYAWTQRQLKDFWNDIWQLEEGKNHYVGVITLEEVKKSTFDSWLEDKWIVEGKSYQPYYVVDGQQRLTTSIIFIQAMLEVAHSKNIKSLNYSTLQEIKSKYILASHGEEISKSYLFGYEKDNPSYEFLKINVFNESSPSGYSKEETIYTTNLSTAKTYFIEKLKILDKEQIEKVFKKITQNFKFNTYTIADDIDVFIAFESMNNRGLRLSNLELLKNRLIYLSTKFDIDQNSQIELRKLINDAWRSVYHYLGKNSAQVLRDDFFLGNHTDMFFGIPDHSGILRRVQGRYSYGVAIDTLSERLLDDIFSTKNSNSEKFEVNAKSVKQYIESISASVSVWFDIYNPHLTNNFNDDERVWLDKINRNKYCLNEFSTLLLGFYTKKPSKVQSLKFLKHIEKAGFMMLIRSTWSSRGSDQYRAMFKMNRDTSCAEMLKALEAYIKSFDEIYASDFRFRFQSTGGFYDWPGIRYFLYEYELHLASLTKQKKIKIDWPQYAAESEDFVTVEHIFPREASDPYWRQRFSSFGPAYSRRLRDSLGNLLPLSKPKNSSLQNKSFDKKVYDGTRVGYKYGSYSEIEVSTLPEWGPTEILNRGISLLEFLEVRWNLKLGDKDKKTDLLGLEFLKSEKQTNNKKHEKVQG